MADAPRKRRWPLFLVIGLALLALAAWWVDRQLQPQRLALTVLAALGESQGLALSFDGPPDYALRPEPRLLLPNFTARQPGAAAPLLTARRLEVSLPWDTIWGGGEEVVVTRFELDQPALDLAALADWRQSRPEAPFKLPTLTQGVLVTNGRVVGSDWRMHALDLEFAELRPDRPFRVDAKGRFERGTLSVAFEAVSSIRRAGLASPFELQATGRVGQDELDAPWSLAVDGQFDFANDAEPGRSQLEIAALSFDGDSPLPSFNATGSANFGEPATLALTGTMPRWPKDWPVLPEPEASAELPLEFSLAYDGPADLSDPLSLEVTRGETRLDARLVIADLQAWLANEARTPLPPMLGRFTAPSLEIEGFTLENVQADLVEPAAASEE
ncbi:AsmA family protein [Arenimonas aestuarii]